MPSYKTYFENKLLSERVFQSVQNPLIKTLIKMAKKKKGSKKC